jgi:integrase
MSNRPQRKPARPRGTGSLYVEHGSWYGTWWVGGRQIKRKVGPLRKPGTREGMTKTQAETRLRELMAITRPAAAYERLTLTEAGARYLLHLEQLMHRKASTLQDYRIMLYRHFDPILGNKNIAKITSDDVLAYMDTKAREGSLRKGKGRPRPLSSKTIHNHLTFLGGIFHHAIKREWATRNPVAALDRPPAAGGDADIRFLELPELDAVIRATPTDDLGAIIALRWRDVDWNAAKVRVRRNRTRGRDGTPKSVTSGRAVPMNDRLAKELARHSQRSAFQTEDDLVFAHPRKGSAYEPSTIRTHFYAALKAAGVKRLRFHDLRHTFGTHMAASGVPMRTLQEWMGHAHLQTTEIYAHYAPQPHEKEWVEQAFGGGADSRSQGDRGDTEQADAKRPLDEREGGAS